MVARPCHRGGTVTNAPYDQIGLRYAAVRREDPRIADAIREAIGDAATVVNVGAGTGSYEPRDRFVVAIEPSLTMIRQRGEHSAPCIQSVAEQLPFGDSTFDAGLAVCTVNHWDWAQGLPELRRVARRVVLFDCFEPDLLRPLWLCDYFREILTFPTASVATVERIASILGPVEVLAVPIHHDCADGFLGAHWRRPEAYLDPGVRQGISCFHRMSNEDVAHGVDALRRDLDSGEWLARHGDLLDRDSLDLGFRVLVSGGAQRRR